jgi:tRNA pseudouridine32 synthase/23S rRNA pseudouridine746 synthase
MTIKVFPVSFLKRRYFFLFLRDNFTFMFHSFRTLVDRSSLPGKFTNPFQYEPHPLCIEAVGEVVSFLETREQWTEELRKGKMFGVLVVESEEGETGFLSAYSGNL